jgi:predicted DNA-binding protein
MVAGYPRLTLRLPPATLARLRAWSKVTGRPAWRLITESVEAAIAGLEGSDARDVRNLAKRERERLSGEE